MKFARMEDADLIVGTEFHLVSDFPEFNLPKDTLLKFQGSAVSFSGDKLQIFSVHGAKNSFCTEIKFSLNWQNHVYRKGIDDVPRK